MERIHESDESKYFTWENLAVVCLLLFVFISIGQLNPIGIAVSHPRYDIACSRLLGLMEGSFGALVTVGAGIGAIISSAVGGFRTAWTLVVVAVGAFILRAYVTLFFAGCGAFCPTCPIP